MQTIFTDGSAHAQNFYYSSVQAQDFSVPKLQHLYATYARRLRATEMKYIRRTAGYIWPDYKTNVQIAKESQITPILDKLLEYERSWIQHVNRMSRNRLPRVTKHYSPAGRRNHGRLLKRLLDTWDRNGSTSGPTAWQIYDDDYDYDDIFEDKCFGKQFRNHNKLMIRLKL